MENRSLPMGFEIGKIYDRLAITRRFGYSDDRQSMRGGLFFRDNTVILIKDEEGEQYEDRWDPYRPGTLLYYATLKSVQVNKEPGIRDLPINSGANKAFRDGDYPIILFSKSKDSYRYMGEFERTDAEPVQVVKNRYYVPGFEIVSKNPDLIEPYIEAYPGIGSTDNVWTEDEVRDFSDMYAHEGLSIENMRAIAMSLHKSTDEIRNVVNALGGGPSDTVSEDLLDRIRQRLEEKDSVDIIGCNGYEVQRTVDVRVNQNVFRRNLDNMFGGKCCLTGASQREVLNASHVYPWCLSDPQEKTNPNNGLLLNKFHDSLFDRFLMTVRVDGTVEYLDGLKDTLGEKLYGKMCAPYDRIEFPGRYAPLRKAYEYHNRRFEGISEIEGRS